MYSRLNEKIQLIRRCHYSFSFPVLFRDERETIEAYFSHGHVYSVIILFLSLYHGINMSLRTLKRRLGQFGLSRRRRMTPLGDVWDAIHEELQGPGKEWKN